MLDPLDTFNLIVGVVSKLFEILVETDALLCSCIEGGLLPHDLGRDYRRRMDQLHNRAENVRSKAHSARTYTEDFVNLTKGLTHSINLVCVEVRVLRANITTSSSRERVRRMALREIDTGRDGQQADACLGRVSPVMSLSEAQDSTTYPERQSDQVLAVPVQEHDAPLMPEIPCVLQQDRDCRNPNSFAIDNNTIPRKECGSGISSRPHHHRRSSNNSFGSTISISSRRKRTGMPLSRARTMTRFIRRIRATRIESHVVEMNTLPPLQLQQFREDEDDDECDWVDEPYVHLAA